VRRLSKNLVRSLISNNFVLICAGVSTVSINRNAAWYDLSCLCGYKLTAILTFEHQQLKLSGSWKLLETYGLTIYGSGWRKDVVSCKLMFGTPQGTPVFGTPQGTPVFGTPEGTRHRKNSKSQFTSYLFCRQMYAVPPISWSSWNSERRNDWYVVYWQLVLNKCAMDPCWLLWLDHLIWFLFDVYVLINALHVDADQVFVCVCVCVCVCVW